MLRPSIYAKIFSTRHLYLPACCQTYPYTYRTLKLGKQLKFAQFFSTAEVGNYRIVTQRWNNEIATFSRYGIHRAEPA